VYGSTEKLAAASGLSVNTLNHIASGRHPSAGVALALARLAGTTVDRVLSGKPASADRCPTCGAKREGGT
jgi:transcriptional regulator with XRE-family HTH domain